MRKMLFYGNFWFIEKLSPCTTCTLNDQKPNKWNMERNKYCKKNFLCSSNFPLFNWWKMRSFAQVQRKTWRSFLLGWWVTKTIKRFITNGIHTLCLILIWWQVSWSSLLLGSWLLLSFSTAAIRSLWTCWRQYSY